MPSNIRFVVSKMPFEENMIHFTIITFKYDEEELNREREKERIFIIMYKLCAISYFVAVWCDYQFFWQPNIMIYYIHIHTCRNRQFTHTYNLTVLFTKEN